MHTFFKPILPGCFSFYGGHRYLSQLHCTTILCSKFRLGGKRGAGVPGYGVPGYGVPGCGKRGVWKTRGVENAGRGKRGVWKTRGLVENAGSGGKRGVWWKTRGLSGKHGGNRIFLTKMRSLNFVNRIIMIIMRKIC